MTHEQKYRIAEINPKKVSELKWFVNKINKGKERYDAVALSLENGIPYWFIGIIHLMEGGGKFTTHLHNGDPLTARTVNVPKGRPIKGQPPFSWEESAIDAISYMEAKNAVWKSLKGIWSISACLDKFEAYNGLGYKRRGVPSPYLWSYTQFYTSGKYAFDGKYDSSLISKQPGVVAIMKSLNIT